MKLKSIIFCYIIKCVVTFSVFISRLFVYLSTILADDNAGYTEWAQWSICEKDCGFNEVKKRQRECTGVCKSNITVDVRNCVLPPCPGV